MKSVIRTENICKRYSDFQDVKDISITVNKGYIYGFIGLNGAGKTTLIRMLLGMITPTSGIGYLLRCTDGYMSINTYNKRFINHSIHIPFF